MGPGSEERPGGKFVQWGFTEKKTSRTRDYLSPQGQDGFHNFILNADSHH